MRKETTRGMLRRSFLKMSAMALGSIPATSLLPAAPGQRHLVRRSAPQRVIIVGGGLAGLAAGWELHATGHRVTLLEARSRAGGRVRTVRAPFSDSLFAEAGGSRISDRDPLIFGYVREFGLAYAPYTTRIGDEILILGGKRIRVPRRDEPPGLDQYPLQLTEAEMKLGVEGLREKAFEKDLLESVGEGDGEGWPGPDFRELDRLSFREFVESNGISPDAASLLWLGQGDPDAVSALWVLRRAAQAVKEQEGFKVIGGNSLLAKGFADRLQERSRYGTPVTKVEQTGQGVRAHVLAGGVAGTIEADRLICAVPSTVLEKIQFDPPLSEEKLAAARGLRYAGGTRILVQARTPYWIGQGYSGFARTDHPAELLNPTHDAPVQREVLDVWLKEGASTRAATMSGEERLEHGLDFIETIYPGIREQAEGGVSVVWEADPWIGGGHSVPGPGWTTDHLAAAARSEGRIHFAGEHTSPRSGTMEGAVESGIRAAREVNDTVDLPLTQ